MRDIAHALVRAGLEHSFGIVGSGPSLRLAEALVDGGARFHVAGHEAAAAIMAATCWRMSGRPSAAVMIKGPGLANAVPGIAHSAFEQQPCLTVAEAYAVDGPANRMHKRMDHVGLLAPLVKTHAGLAAESPVDDLLATATAEVPGPVHLDLAVTGHTPIPDPPGDIVPRRPDDLLRALNQARRPVVVCGGLAWRRRWRHRLAGLAVPVFTTVAAKGVLDERAHASAGVYTGAGGRRSPERLLLDQADLVVGLGLRSTEVLEPGFGAATVLLDEVDASPGFGTAQLVLAEDALVDEVLDRLTSPTWGLDVVAEARQRLEASFDLVPWWAGTPARVLDGVAWVHSLVVDTGLFCTAAEHGWSASGGRRFLASANGRYMGVSVPMAVGAAIGQETAPVVCLVGDGGIRTYPGELKLAVAHQLPLCVVLVRDGIYASIAGPGAPPPATRVPESSWWEIMARMGLQSTAVDDADGLAAALDSWDRRTPRFVQCDLPPDWDRSPLEGVR